MSRDGRPSPNEWPRTATIATVAGAVLCVVGLIVAPRRTAAAYLVAYVAVLAVVLGVLAMIMIARLTAATWFVALRRQAEQVTATLPALAVMFVPVLFAARWLYPWASRVEDPNLRAAIEAKSAYLNLPFFIIRGIVYWAIWIGVGETLRRASLAQDHGDSPRVAHRLRVVSAVGIVAFALSVTFAAFDWMMSLSPSWYSTVYGVNYFAGAMVGGLGLIAVLTERGRRSGELPEAVGADHLHALAKLLLTFVLFWAYIGFSQFIVIWSAEIPVESTWYVVRTRGGWSTLGIAILAGHFVVPLLALLLLAVKRRPALIAALGAWLLAMHYLDCYWNVMPDASSRAPSTMLGPLWDFGALLLVCGVVTLTWSVRRAGEPAIPQGDPRLVPSLEYSTRNALG
ncbi:MAG TPA: hypothetical protein VJW73_02700 [Gemmatimonadaceae bacterium]|nr:hypothetical protein [Gemmatimonadaceae bacterium]